MRLELQAWELDLRRQHVKKFPAHSVRDSGVASHARYGGVMQGLASGGVLGGLRGIAWTRCITCLDGRSARSLAALEDKDTQVGR